MLQVVICSLINPLQWNYCTFCFRNWYFLGPWYNQLEKVEHQMLSWFRSCFIKNPCVTWMDVSYIYLRFFKVWFKGNINLFLIHYCLIPKTRVILLNWCAWFLRMKRPGEDRVRSACHNKAPRSSLTSVELNPSVSASQSTNGNVLYVGVRSLEGIQYSTAATSLDSGVLSGRLVGRAGEDEMLLPTGHSSSVGSVEPELAKILDEVRYIAKRFREQDEDEAVCNEWKFAASVIDRLCLMAFSLFTILCTIGILMSAPNFVEAISKDFFNWRLNWRYKTCNNHSYHWVTICYFMGP